MTPEEIKNESMRVLKGKEIEEIDKKVEKDMIELTILEVAENIEKYQRETRAWRDKKVVRKDIKTGDLLLKRKKIGRTQENFMSHGKGLTSPGKQICQGLFA
jgi:hypothetical protein